MSVKVTVLGCGNSDGTPAAGNFWGACDPAEPKNTRTRPSIAVRSAKTTIIVDTGPDFRHQVNREDIRSLDAVLYTHVHGDHVSGIDDLRAFFKRTKQRINIYGSKETIDELKEHYSYQFVEKSVYYPQVLEANVILSSQYGKTMRIGDIDFIPFEQDHGTCKSMGFRFGNLAYSTDLVGLPEESIETLQGLETWIVDGAGYKMEINRVHFTLEQLYKMNERVKARKVYITHLAPSMDYQTLIKELPENYVPVYDGLELDCD